jgi:hypothetical protein
MGNYKLPPKVKLVVGLLGQDDAYLAGAREILKAEFGEEEEILPPLPFTWTSYYERELGSSPLRSFLSYADCIPRESLVDIKRFTNSLEADLAIGGSRCVNIDPGYLTLGQFFLATTKDQRHRVYVRDGIFVEPTLFFQDGKFHPFEWTYPDYRSPEYLQYFGAVRSRLASQLRNAGPARPPGTPAPEPGGASA